jgi:putative membrane protein
VTLAHAFVTPADVWGSWLTHPEALVFVVASAAWYAHGARLLASYPRARMAAFFAGVVVIAMALASPLDAVAEAIFSAHMAQHLLLVVVAAPLLAYGAPAVPMLRALHAGLRHRIGRLPRASGRFARQPLLALALHAMVIWVWHLPATYEAAVGDDLIHALEHGSLIATAFWFWATIIPARRRSAAAHPLRILALFGHMLQSGALGVLLVFAAQPLYEIHRAGALAWGSTPLEDQQLAGLLMWVPPAPVLLVAMSVLFVRWLQLIEMRTRAREAMPHA